MKYPVTWRVWMSIIPIDNLTFVRPILQEEYSDTTFWDVRDIVNARVAHPSFADDLGLTIEAYSRILYTVYKQNGVIESSEYTEDYKQSFLEGFLE